MNIEKWIEEERVLLAKFHVWWAAEHKVRPDAYPMDLSAGEWDEQYRLWSSSLPD